MLIRKCITIDSIKTTTGEEKSLTDEQEIIAELEAEQANAANGTGDGTDNKGSSSDGDQKGKGWKEFWGTE